MSSGHKGAPGGGSDATGSGTGARGAPSAPGTTPAVADAAGATPTAIEGGTTSAAAASAAAALPTDGSGGTPTSGGTLLARALPWLAAAAVATGAAAGAEAVAAAAGAGAAGGDLAFADLVAVLGAALAAHGLVWTALAVFAAVLHAPLRGEVSLRVAWSWLREASARPPDARRLAAGRLYAAAITVVLFLAVAYRLNHHFLTAYRNQQLAALALAAAILGVAAAHFVLWAVLAGGMARALAAADRAGLRLLADAPSSPRFAAGAIALAGLAFAAAVAFWKIESVRQISWGAPLGAATLAAVWIAARETFLAPVRAGRLRPAAVAAVAGIVAALGGYGLAATLLPDRPRAVTACASGGLVLPRLFPLLQGPDADDDGYRARLGGGDCDDGDPEVNPGAVDHPGNGHDEDCDGADLERYPGAASAPATGAADAGGPASGPASAPALPRVDSVVLVTVDSLRADRLGAYGYERPTTPALDALAARSVRYARAYAPASFTPKSIPTMLCGRHPGEVRRDYAHFAKFRDSNVSIAEVLSAAGVRTAGFASHWYFRKKFGFEQGFGTWDTGAVPADTSLQEDAPLAAPLTDRVLAWLAGEGAATTPYFLWVHHLDPHKLYKPPAEFARFGPKQSDRYDGEVAYVDANVGRLLEALAARPDAGRTAVIVSADHGEAFGEHGTYHHGHELWEELVRVPFIVYVPGLEGRAGTVIERRVGLVDLVPTIAALLGVGWPADAAALRGVSLLPEIAGAGALPPRDVWIDHPRGPFNPPRRAFVRGDLKLHHDVASGAYRLFDLAADPEEKKDLWGADAARDKELVQAYKRMLAGLDDLRVEPDEAEGPASTGAPATAAPDE